MPATRLSIARLAGVSVATVDRVIRNDPAVRAETSEKVRQAMESLRSARAGRGRPAKHATIRVAFVLPALQSTFLDRVQRDIELSASFFREHRITPSFYRCEFSNQRETRQFADVARGYDALVVLPLDYAWLDRLIDECREAGIPVITIFADRPASGRALFRGADNRMMGRTAGLLMGRFIGTRTGTVVMLSGSSRRHDQVERRTGFEQVLEEDFRELRWAVEPDFPTHDAKTCRAWAKALAGKPDIVGVYCACEITDGLAHAFKAMPQPRPVIVGHGISDTTRAMLTEGNIDVVLDQDARGVVHAAGIAALNLVNDVRGATVASKQSIQIYLRENANT